MMKMNHANKFLVSFIQNQKISRTSLGNLKKNFQILSAVDLYQKYLIQLVTIRQI